MFYMLLALLVCLQALAALGSPYHLIPCKYGQKLLKPGESHVFEQNCARYTCTCDPRKSKSYLIQAVMIGCYSAATNTCYKKGDKTTINSASGSPLQCVCLQGPGKSFVFGNCHSQRKKKGKEICLDSVTNQEKKKGEEVNRLIDGVNYVCTCAGTKGYKNCRRTEMLVKVLRIDKKKCRDSVSGLDVPVGSEVRIKQGGLIYHCKCQTGNTYDNCRKSTCTHIDGTEKKVGEKVTIKPEKTKMECDCAGLDGYKNCRPTDVSTSHKGCLDMVTGRHEPVGSEVKMKRMGLTYYCTCKGGDVFENCRKLTCTHTDGTEKKVGEKVDLVSKKTVLTCTCAGFKGYQNCLNAKKCRNADGDYIDKGKRFQAENGSKKMDCLCMGNNSGKDCKDV